MNEVLTREAAVHVAAFRSDLRAGRPWPEALLAAIASWDIAGERVEGRQYRYLIAGEAFDWLLLAERLCDAVAGEALLPAAEIEALLWEERWPAPLREETFREALGPSKYRAHLNFVYGVRVEEALQLAVEEQVRKDRGIAAFRHDARGDGDPFQRIYGATRGPLLRDFRQARGQAMVDRISLSELKEFTYWLFKKRLSVQDPARVASDTRRGLQRLQALEELRGGGHPGAAPMVAPAAAPVIDGIAVPVG